MCTTLLDFSLDVLASGRYISGCDSLFVVVVVVLVQRAGGITNFAVGHSILSQGFKVLDT